MDENGFEEVEHTADWALHVIADDFEGLLKIAAIGMLELMGLASVKSGGRERKIEVKGFDREDLLVAWLEELLFLAERNGVGFGAMELRVSGNSHLVARIEEIPAMIPEKEIKAVTYHGLEVKETETGLEVTIVFDV